MVVRVINVVRWFLFSLLYFVSCQAMAQITELEQKQINRTVIQQENERNQREIETKERLDQLTPVKDVRLQDQNHQEDEINTLLKTDEHPCFVINHIQLLGENAADFKWALGFAKMGRDQKGKLVSDLYQGRCLGNNSISLLAKRVQGALIDQGFTTSKILLDPQNLKQGILSLRLVVGRVGEVRYVISEPDQTKQNNQSRLNNAMVMKRGDILNLRDIEQSLENLKRVPTVEANFQLKPSQFTKASDSNAYSDIEIAWQQNKSWRWNVNLDDSGGVDTGRYQMGATASLDNPFGLSDLFYINVGRNVPAGWPNLAHKSWSINTHYSVPWGLWQWSVNASKNSYLQTFISRNGVSDLAIYYSGTSSTIDMKLSRLVYRDQTKKDTVGFRMWAKSSHNYQEFGDTGFKQEQEMARKRTAGWDLSWNRRWFIENSTIDSNVMYRRGIGAFGAIDPLDQSVDKHPKLWQAEVQYVKPIRGGGWLGGKWLENESFRYSGQWKIQANKNRLSPADRYGLGSRSWIRGFVDDGWVSGDRGWGVKNDVSWLKSWGGVACDIYLGWDWGKVGGDSVDQGDVSAQANRGVIRSGMALGVRANQAIGKSELNYEVFAAKPLIKPDLFQGDNTVYGVSISWSF